MKETEFKRSLLILAILYFTLDGIWGVFSFETSPFGSREAILLALYTTNAFLGLFAAITKGRINLRNILMAQLLINALRSVLVRFF